VSINAPNSRRNLDIAIDRIFKDQANPLQVRTIIANTIVAQLLPNGAIKGGSSLRLRYGDKITRFTRDLDTARAEGLDEFLLKLEAALQEGWHEFAGRVVRKEPAKPKNVPGEYIMQPFEIKLSYHGKSWVTVPLEIGHDEVGDTKDADYYISPDIVRMFETLGLPVPKPVALMPISHQIAQKLHALSEEGSERAHDLIDLQIIIKNEPLDFSLVKKACVRLFISRRMQKWPPNISKGSDWDSLYSSQVMNLDVFKTVDEAIIWVNRLVDSIDSAEDNGI